MSDREDDLFGSAGEDDVQMDDVASPASDAYEEPKRRNVVLPRLAPSHEVKSVYSARVPAFLRIDPKPFDADEYISDRKSNKKTAEDVAFEENSLRWKYAVSKDANQGQHVTKVSNARIVEWSDGSRTLQLGAEHFEIRGQKSGDSKVFVCAVNNSQKVLQTAGIVEESLTFLPTSTSSATHLKLAQTLARKQEADQIRIGSVFQAEDPEKVRKDLEKAELMKERNRRKLAAQREEEPISYTDRSQGTPLRTGSYAGSASPNGEGELVNKDNDSEDESIDELNGYSNDEVDDDERERRLHMAKTDLDEAASGSDANSDNDNENDAKTPTASAPETMEGTPGQDDRPIRRTQVLDDDSD